MALPVRLTLLAGVLLASTAARAQSPSVELAEIRELILHASYDEAIERVRALLERPGLDAQSHNVALEVLATAHIANRDQTNADRVLAELYSRDPGHRLSDPDASPVVQAAFQRARERHPTTVDVRLEHVPPIVERRESPLIEVRVTEGRDAVGEVRLAYRTGGAPRYARLVMTLDEDGVARGRIPLVGPPGAEQRVEYFILALAPSMTPLSQLGDEAEPMELTIPAEPARARTLEDSPRAHTGTTEPATSSPSTRSSTSASQDEGSGSRWWVGLLVGVAVAGLAAVGSYYLLREEAPDGSLGHATLR